MNNRFLRTGAVDRTRVDDLSQRSQVTETLRGNRESLIKDYTNVKEIKNEVLMVVQLNRYHKLKDTFGGKRMKQFLQVIQHDTVEWAEQMGASIYLLQEDLIAFTASYSESDIFMNSIEMLIEDMAEIEFQYEGITYSNHCTYTYVAYFMNFAIGYVPDIEMILDNLILEKTLLENGMDTVGEIYNGANDSKWQRLEKLTSEVREAWDNHEFTPYYQLVYDIKSGEPVAAELLARWIHPELGVLTPGEFLSILEKQGLIMNLELYMLEEACKKIQQWIDNEEVSVPITINVAKINFHRKDFLPKVLEIVQRYDTPGVLLIMEVEESSIVTEMVEMQDTIRALRDYGIQISVDRFAATEYSSLNILRDLPIDSIKVSPNFFPKEDAERREKIYVRNVIRMLRDLGIRTVAERTETAEDLEIFKEYGCECAQGFYYSRPMCAEDFEKVVL